MRSVLTLFIVFPFLYDSTSLKNLPPTCITAIQVLRGLGQTVPPKANNKGRMSGDPDGGFTWLSFLGLLECCRLACTAVLVFCFIKIYL